MPRDPMSGQELPEERGSGVFPRYDGPDRRGSGDDASPFAGLPGWTKALAVVGIPGALALFLVWVGSQSLPKLEAELIAMRLEAERNRLAVQQQVTQGEQMYRLMQRICANAAKSDDERSRCFDR